MRPAFLALPAAFLIVSACAHQQPDWVTLENSDDELKEQLLHSAQDIQRRWGVTSRLSSLKFQDHTPTLEVSRLDPSLRRMVAFPGGFQGELENFIAETASMSGYDYQAPSGRAPVRGIPIVFDEQYRTLGEYVYDAGIQAGSRATVVMDMQAKVLHIIYEGR